MQSKTIRYYLDKWPGKKSLGIYRFLPIFFGLGAALEFSMINWKVGSTNFCKLILNLYTSCLTYSVLIFNADSTFRRRRAEILAKQSLGIES